MSPAVEGILKCFAVQRGDLKNRIDVTFHDPAVAFALSELRTSRFEIVEIKQLLDGNLGIRYGTGTPPPIVEPGKNSLPFIRATDIKDNEILLDGLLHIDAVQPISMDKCRVQSGELILVRSGVNTGDCAVVPPVLDGSYAAYDLIIRFNERAIPDYVSYFLNTRHGRAQINTRKGRAAQPHINAEEVSSIKIPLPSLDIQQALVNQIEAARAERQSKFIQADELLKEIDVFVLKQLGLDFPQGETRAIFAVMQGSIKRGRLDPVYYTPHYYALAKALEDSNYPKVTLGEISPEIVGGATPTKGNAELYAESGIKFLRILNVGINEIVLKDLKYIKQPVHNGELKRSQLNKDDVLMTITGRVGTAAIVQEEILPANINQHIIRLRVRRKDFMPEYLAIYLNTSIGNALSNRGVTGGTRIALDYETIRKIQIPQPPLPIQEKIIAELSHLRSEAQRLHMEAESRWQETKRRFEDQLLGEAEP